MPECTCPPEVRSGEAPVPDATQRHLAVCPLWVKPPTQHVTANTAVIDVKAFGSGPKPRMVPVNVIALNSCGKKVRLRGPAAARFLKVVMARRPPETLAALVDEIQGRKRSSDD